MINSGISRLALDRRISENIGGLGEIIEENSELMNSEKKESTPKDALELRHDRD